jgi:hypothetical protein
MKSWRAQFAGAAMLGLMALLLGIEASNLKPRTAGSAPSVPTSSPIALGQHTCAQTDASDDNLGVTQSPEGRFSACLRVGNIAAGAYQIVARGNGKSGLRSGAAVSTAGASISLTPSSGPPGTKVKISGFIPGVTGALPADDHAELCWAGCDGLTGFVPVQWSTSQPGHFTSEFAVPAAPWYSSNGVVPLRPGRYSVAFPCLPATIQKPNGECQSGQLATTFDLLGPASAMCLSGSPCASLRATPDAAAPGQVVAVDGWAPLTGLADTSFLAVGLEGGASNEKPGYQSAVPVVASTAFTVASARAWAGLPALHPLSVLRTGPATIAVDPRNPSRFAYCADGAVEITANAGATWSAISLAGVHTASASTNYPIPNSYAANSHPTCDGLALDGRYAGTIYAVFDSVPRNSSPPPFYFVAYVSRNNGRTWQPVPVPSGSETGRFGGFRVDASAAQALFWKSDGTMAPADQSSFIVQETADGGASWHRGALRCPSSGPCLNLGPQDNGRCMAVGEWQTIELSADHGSSWTSSGWPGRLSACSTSELIGLSDGGIAALDGMSQFPLTLSSGGDVNWESIALPAAPDNAGLGGCCDSVLQILSDGRLLLTNGSSWYLLSTGAATWCVAHGAPSTQGTFQASAPTVVRDRLWWIESNRNGPGEFVSRARSVALAAVHC